jgi:hypothetical protein
VKLRAIFDNDREVLFPNQFVNIKLLVNTLHDVNIVPASAVQRGAPGTFLYIVKADPATVGVRKVMLGPADGQRIAILSGVEPGESVVIDGTDRLRQGAQVKTEPARTSGGGGPLDFGTGSSTLSLDKIEPVSASPPKEIGRINMEVSNTGALSGLLTARNYGSELKPESLGVFSASRGTSFTGGGSRMQQRSRSAPLSEKNILLPAAHRAAETAALIDRGDRFMAARDITSARLLYQSAVESGDARAALRMGATFDPTLVDRLGAIGSAANQQQALYWHQYARDLDYADGLARDPIDRSDR